LCILALRWIVLFARTLGKVIRGVKLIYRF
jgi:hypothetical protein